MVQELRKTVRRVDTSGEGSLLTGKLFVWAVMKVENIGESLGAFIRS